MIPDQNIIPAWMLDIIRRIPTEDEVGLVNNGTSDSRIMLSTIKEKEHIEHNLLELIAGSKSMQLMLNNNAIGKSSLVEISDNIINISKVNHKLTSIDGNRWNYGTLNSKFNQSFDLLGSNDLSNVYNRYFKQQNEKPYLLPLMNIVAATILKSLIVDLPADLALAITPEHTHIEFNTKLQEALLNTKTTINNAISNINSKLNFNISSITSIENLLDPIINNEQLFNVELEVVGSISNNTKDLLNKYIPGNLF
jgi:hypothetical protein